MVLNNQRSYCFTTLLLRDKVDLSEIVLWKKNFKLIIASTNCLEQRGDEGSQGRKRCWCDRYVLV